RADAGSSDALASRHAAPAEAGTPNLDVSVAVRLSWRDMAHPAYMWRELTPTQQADLLAWRKDRRYPWHSPPHRPNYGHNHFLVSAACYEHQPHIGLNPERLEQFSKAWLALLCAHA